MNLLTYILKGKTQYGLHSPFVYDFYTETLLPRVNKRKANFGEMSRTERRNASFIYKLADRFEVKNIVLCGFQKGIPFAEWVENVLPQLVEATNLSVRELAGGKKERLLIVCPIGCYSMLKYEMGDFPSDAIVVITDIHRGKLAEKQWDAVCEDNSNILTADLYSMGVVFFRKELSVQRFLLLV